MLRSIRPKRARRPFDASVDPTEARQVTGCVLGYLRLRRRISRRLTMGWAC